MSTPPASRYHLRLYLLGPPRVETMGRALDIARRQVRALLYVLAAELQPVPREHLVFLFWPDQPEAAGRRNLTHLLTHLRATLSGADLVWASADRVGLTEERVWSDSAALLEAARRLPPSEPADVHLRASLAAVELYRGPFLDGFSLPGSAEFELWVLRQRRRCERTYLRLLTALVDRSLAERDLEAAIAWSQRHLATDPLAEEVHRRLIELYAATGRRAAALRQYEHCAGVLERELGVRPLPETRAAYEAALREAPTLPVTRAAPVVPGPPPSRDPPLVGRAEALRHLYEAFADSRAGRGRVVLILGEAGIGKSRLMATFAHRISGEARVATAGGRIGGERVPYRPVIRLLRTLMELPTPDPAGDPGPPPLFGGLDDVWLAELSRLVPELRTRRSDLAPALGGDAADARARLIEAACRAVFSVAEASGPLILGIDDLQWIDDATHDWLLCLAEGLAERRCLLLIGCRSDEHETLDPLREALARRAIVRELPLAGLDRPALGELVEQVLNQYPAHGITPAGRVALTERLSAVTGGNPFFALEILRALTESPHPASPDQALAALPLPETVRQAVTARLRRLSPAAIQLMESGAVLRTSFGVDAAARTAGRDELEAIDALDELTARLILVEHEGVYGFQHEITRQVVEGDLSPVRRQLLHRRAGHALAQLGGARPASIAEHYDLGGEPALALPYYAKAAAEAEALLAWEVVVELQARRLMALDRVDPDRRHPVYLAQRGEILASRAHAHFLQGHLQARDQDLDDLTALAGAAADERLQLQAQIEQVRYLNLDAHYARAIEVAQAALPLTSQLHDGAARSRLLAQIGFAHYFLGEPGPALDALQEALAATGGTDDPALRGRISHILGYVHFHLGDYARALACQEEALACHRAAGDPNRVAWDGLDVGAARLELGRTEEAEALIVEHLTLARRIGSRPAEAYGLTLYGCVALHRGDYPTALARFSEASSLQQSLHSDHGAVAAQLGTGLALSRLGELEAARRELTQAAHRARAIDHRRRLAEVLLALGRLEDTAGRRETAGRHLAEALTLARETRCWEVVTVALIAHAALARHAGHIPQAVALATEALAAAEAHALPGPRAWAEAELGLALLDQGDAQAALEHTERAVAGRERLHEAWIGHDALHRAHEQVLRTLGQHAAADAQRALADASLARKASYLAKASTSAPQSRSRAFRGP